MVAGIPNITWIAVAVVIILGYVALSTRRIGPAEVGLVLKRISHRKLTQDNPIAFHGEAGYQADLLMPGLRWKPILTVMSGPLPRERKF
ncbi:MAG TPA: hypothetical protein VGU63_03920 [Candidatus Acidoferrales bacterium]|nr:hypothetical protein [Candidatus Acidoferrales bacterium]